MNKQYGVSVRDFELDPGYKSGAKNSRNDGNLIIEMIRSVDWPVMSPQERFLYGLNSPGVWYISGASNAFASDFLSWSGRSKVAVIYLDDNWIRALTAKNGNQWIRAMVLAHELGHCYYGHQYGRGPDNVWQREYDADFFAGTVLCKLGASVEQAWELYDYISVDAPIGFPEDRNSHPSRQFRRQAVLEGWTSARCR